MRYHYLYKITNIINNKIYIGAHTTDNLDDAYMGSGDGILVAIKKYGIHNFKKEILGTFDSADTMYLREKEIVTAEFVSRQDTYNRRIGGIGGFSQNAINQMVKYRKQEAAKLRIEYYRNPLLCLECDDPIKYRKPSLQSLFCNKSCSTRFNNRKRIPRSEESRAKTSIALLGRRLTESHRLKVSIGMKASYEKRGKDARES